MNILQLILLVIEVVGDSTEPHAWLCAAIEL